MLNNKIQQLQWQQLKTTYNELNEEILDYLDKGIIDIAISFNTKSLYYSNDSNLINCQFIGITDNSDISKGDKIGPYVVEFVQGGFLWLKEVGNNGRI